MPRITVASIKRAVGEHYGIDIMERSNRREVSRPRQAAMYLSMLLTKHSNAHVSHLFERDHSTGWQARRSIEKVAGEQDEDLHKDMLDITRQLMSEASA